MHTLHNLICVVYVTPVLPRSHYQTSPVLVKSGVLAFQSAVFCVFVVQYYFYSLCSFLTLMCLTYKGCSYFVGKSLMVTYCKNSCMPLVHNNKTSFINLSKAQSVYTVAHYWQSVSSDSHTVCMYVCVSQLVFLSHTWLLRTNRKRRLHLPCYHLCCTQ